MPYLDTPHSALIVSSLTMPLKSVPHGSAFPNNNVFLQSQHYDSYNVCGES
jgi:hypothetical protein